MFNLGMPELILVLVIALVVFGPSKLPEIGKALGRSLQEFKKATSDAEGQGALHAEPAIEKKEDKKMAEAEKK